MSTLNKQIQNALIQVVRLSWLITQTEDLAQKYDLIDQAHEQLRQVHFLLASTEEGV